MRMHRATRSIRPGAVGTLLFGIALTATTAMAQDSVGTVSEAVTTRRDLNGRDAVSEKVVTHQSRRSNDELVVIETYLPTDYADRLTLNWRVRRVTTRTDEGSRIVAETEERSPAGPGEPLRLVQRSVTTVRKTGTDSYVSEQEVFEVDANGRLVLVSKQRENSRR
jgi:hypothetical protein